MMRISASCLSSSRQTEKKMLPASAGQKHFSLHCYTLGVSGFKFTFLGF